MTEKGKKRLTASVRKSVPTVLAAWMLLLTLGGCGGSPAQEPEEAPAAVEPDHSAAAPETAVAQDAGDGVFGFRDTLSADYFDLSILDAKWTDSLETEIGIYAPEKDGAKLLCLIFSAKNTADEMKNLGMFNAYVDGKAVLPTVVAGGIDDAMVFVGAVASGMEMDAYSVWELPNDWEEFQIYYLEADGSSGEQHFVIHRSDISE